MIKLVTKEFPTLSGRNIHLGNKVPRACEASSFVRRFPRPSRSHPFDATSQINLITTVAVTKIQATLRARKTNKSELPLKKLTQQWRHEFLNALEKSQGAGEEGEAGGRR